MQLCCVAGRNPEEQRKTLDRHIDEAEASHRRLDIERKKTGSQERDGQREPDVAQADDDDLGGAGAKLLVQCAGGIVVSDRISGVHVVARLMYGL